MEKGYYINYTPQQTRQLLSQSTIKMEKGYYPTLTPKSFWVLKVAIHNKNGKGLLPYSAKTEAQKAQASQSTIKMEKGYYHFVINGR